MPNVPLPSEPSLEHLRNEARDLQRAVRAGDAAALAHVAEHHAGGVPAAADRSRFRLADAQVVVARHHGFAGWPRLKHHLDMVAEHSRAPDQAEIGDDVGDRFLSLACLTYGDDGPERWAAARRLLAEHPEIPDRNIYAAAATSDASRVQGFLDADPRAARSVGGPFRWTALFHLAYARHDPNVSESAVLETAGALLAAGADPNAGYLWHGLPTPFTVLTGVFGEGELGPRRQPPHPRARALARLLLEAGADPNDGQALYNRMFSPADDHLELLFEFGLGTGGGGPWKRRLGSALDTPAQMLTGQLAWAVVHDMRDRARLLIDHGVDAGSPALGERTPAETAALAGNADMVELLVGRGAAPPALDGADAFVAAALAGRRHEIEDIVAASPDVVEAARLARPALMVWAAAIGRADSVALLIELGFDVNAMGRGDVPSDQPWQTALHCAAEQGDVELAGVLLASGADPDRKDARFDGTPLGWARYFEQEEMVTLLEALTAPEEP